MELLQTEKRKISNLIRNTAAASLVTVILATPALAETCEDRFKEILLDDLYKGPVKITSVQEIKGGMVSTSINYQASKTHWMTEMVEPDTLPWSMMHDGKLYTSADKGSSWTFVRDMDQAQIDDTHASNMAENVTTVREAVCGTEEIDGVQHDTVEATYETLQNFKTENRFKYWINPSDGWVTKAYYHMKGANFESTTTQTAERGVDLELPKPE